MSSVKKVLVLCARKLDRLVFADLDQLPSEEREKYSFLYFYLEDGVDIDEYTEQCIEMVKQQDVDAVLSASDFASLVHAAISQTFPHIRGPSVESVFLTCHKHYSRELIGSDVQQVRSIVLDLDQNLGDIMRKATEFYERSGGVCCLKPAMGEASTAVYKVTNTEELKAAVTSLKKDRRLKYISESFLKKWLDVKLYPYSLSHCAMMEEFIDASRTVVTTCYVQNDQVAHASVTDWVFHENPPREGAKSFAGGITPSPVTKDSGRAGKLWEATDIIVKKLIQKGFNDQFIDFEFFPLPNGDFTLLEFNGRIQHDIGPVHRQVFENGDLMQIFLKLVNGENIQKPIQRQGVVGFCGYVDTYCSGKGDDILDFGEVCKIPEVTARCSPDDFISVGEIMCGPLVASTALTGSSFEELRRKHYDICRRILKKPEFSSLEKGCQEMHGPSSSKSRQSQQSDL
ncbi:uncharacterized protein [Ptychodera flava]|uniref:uncharacterized protein n=1 Tax=Ptychodera flava TaxID=63121 RepID=UPI00396A2B14